MGTSRTITVITAPTAEPVTLAEVKETLRVLHNDDDSMISKLIKVAREFAEAYCSLTVMTTVLERSYDAWPGSEFELDIWPIQSIDSVKYDDTSSPVTEQTLVVNTDYYADTTTEGGRIKSVSGFPSTAIKPNPIRVRVTAGYSSRDNVPEQIKEGIKAYVAYLYDGNEIMAKVAKDILWSERRI